MPESVAILSIEVVFDVSKMIYFQGRQYPVQPFYLREPCGDYLVAAMTAVWDIHTRENFGHILVFLTGQEVHNGTIVHYLTLGNR